MFFIFGISSGEKKLNFVQTMLCPTCGQFGRLELYMTYTFMSLFFIPVFRWNRSYYVKSTCCGSIYAITTDMGKRIQKGDMVNLSEQDLQLINKGYRKTEKNHCPHCGYLTDQDFEYCPKCGNRL